MNPEPGNELQFKAPLARAEPFMNELRRLGFDVGHDADYEDPTHYMTVIVRDVPAGRKRLLLDTANRYVALLKQNNPGNPGPEQRRTLHRAIAPGNAEPNKTHYFCEGCKSPLSWCEKHNMYHHAFSFSPECRSVDNPGNPGEKTVHGYNYRVRIWYPNAPENKTEGMMLAAYDEDLAKQIQRQYPGVTYEIISKEPVLGDPQQLSRFEKGNIVRIRADGRVPTSKIRAEVIDVGMGSVTVRIIEPDPLGILKIGQEITVGTDTVRKASTGNPGVDGNLRDRLIAEIIKNRMAAWNRGVKGVRPWSENDLTELRSMTTAELEQTAKLTTQLSFAPSGESQGYPQRKWAPSQVWGACKQAGIPVEERDVIVKHYQETGELPFQTWPSLRLIESWPEQPQLSPGTKNEIAHEQLEEAGGNFDLYVYADRTWKMSGPSGVAEGKYDQEGHSYEAKHQHPFIRDWINEQGEILFGKVPSWQIDPELERKAQQNWDALRYDEKRKYMIDYVEEHIPGSKGWAFTTWEALPNNIKDFIRHAYAGEQAGNRYVVEAEVTSRRIYYVTAENEEDAQQKIRNRDYHDEREKGDYWWEFKFTEVRPARPDESQYYP